MLFLELANHHPNGILSFGDKQAYTVELLRRELIENPVRLLISIVEEHDPLQTGERIYGVV